MTVEDSMIVTLMYIASTSETLRLDEAAKLALEIIDIIKNIKSNSSIKSKLDALSVTVASVVCRIYKKTLGSGVDDEIITEEVEHLISTLKEAKSKCEELSNLKRFRQWVLQLERPKWVCWNKNNEIIIKDRASRVIKAEKQILLKIPETPVGRADDNLHAQSVNDDKPPAYTQEIQGSESNNQPEVTDSGLDIHYDHPSNSRSVKPLKDAVIVGNHSPGVVITNSGNNISNTFGPLWNGSNNRGYNSGNNFTHTQGLPQWCGWNNLVHNYGLDTSYGHYSSSFLPQPPR